MRECSGFGEYGDFGGCVVGVWGFGVCDEVFFMFCGVDFLQCVGQVYVVWESLQCVCCSYGNFVVVLFFWFGSEFIFYFIDCCGVWEYVVGFVVLWGYYVCGCFCVFVYMVCVDVMFCSYFVRLEIILLYVYEIFEVCFVCGLRIERMVFELNLCNFCQIFGQSIVCFLIFELS